MYLRETETIIIIYLFASFLRSFNAAVESSTSDPIVPQDGRLVLFGSEHKGRSTTLVFQAGIVTTTATDTFLAQHADNLRHAIAIVWVFVPRTLE